MGNINTMDEFIQSFTNQRHLPGLRAYLDEKMADCPYQVMAVYQRSRHSGQKGEYWPDKPESMPAISRYPNILVNAEMKL